MASSKSFLLLFCALLALVLLVSAEVSTSKDDKNESGKNAAVDFVGRCPHGCCVIYSNRPGCYRCCGSAEEAPGAVFEDDPRN